MKRSIFARYVLEKILLSVRAQHRSGDPGTQLLIRVVVLFDEFATIVLKAWETAERPRWIPSRAAISVPAMVLQGTSFFTNYRHGLSRMSMRASREVSTVTGKFRLKD